MKFIEIEGIREAWEPGFDKETWPDGWDMTVFDNLSQGCSGGL